MYPKQLLTLAGEQTMLQATALRSRGLDDLADHCLIVANEAHRFSIAEQLGAIDIRGEILLEPQGRNTAPAVAIAALHAQAADDDVVLLVMPADHVIKNTHSFRKAIESGMVDAKDGKLVTFGIAPTAPETGYGYVRAEVDGSKVVSVEEFVEKPDAPTAQAYLDDGRYFWNSGMFLFKASAYLGELERLAPGIFAACRDSMANKTLDGDFVRPDHEAFLGCPSDSIDYAVMEKSGNAAMIPLDAGWSDVGSWSALQDVTPSDDHGNALSGDVLVHDCKRSYVQAESRLVAGVGLEDVIIVETKDAVLVARRQQSQDVKELVSQLKAKGRSEINSHRQVFRPWGSYDGIDYEDNFQVKRLIVKPGAVLSLQRHAHRSEHWVVVKGTARITRNDEEFDLNVNESTYIAIGDVHRIANPYDEVLHIIEVQCGDYLGEDDIVRIEDGYGREGTNT
jgi:mannose-1-phosphate guanylyltransferase/mannose-6-phosphate isomerase